MLYRYAWGNTPVRARWKGRTVKIVAQGTMNTVLVLDVKTGETMTTSRRALRKLEALRD